MAECTVPSPHYYVRTRSPWKALFRRFPCQQFTLHSKETELKQKLQMIKLNMKKNKITRKTT